MVKQDIIAVAESRQVWSLLGGLVEAILAILHIRVPALATTIVSLLFTAIFVDGTITKAVAIHAKGSAVPKG